MIFIPKVNSIYLKVKEIANLINIQYSHISHFTFEENLVENICQKNTINFNYNSVHNNYHCIKDYNKHQHNSIGEFDHHDMRDDTNHQLHSNRNMNRYNTSGNYNRQHHARTFSHVLIALCENNHQVCIWDKKYLALWCWGMRTNYVACR